MTGKTKSGFEFKIDDNAADDWEMLEDLSSGDAYGEIKAAKRLLPGDQYNKLKEHCRDKSGKVSFKKVDTELGEILTSLSKNS